MTNRQDRIARMYGSVPTRSWATLSEDGLSVITEHV